MAELGVGAGLDGDYLDVAVRAWAVPDNRQGDEDEVEQSKHRQRRVPDHFLVFDTETTTDPSQRLLFGCFRYLRRDEQGEDFDLVCVEEGIFYPDDLGSWDPHGHAVLEHYVRATPDARVDTPVGDAMRTLRARPLRWFLSGRLWRAARGRLGVVCFNFPFDLSRLAWECRRRAKPAPQGRTRPV